MDYIAPLGAIGFTLRHIAGFDALIESGAFPGLDWPTAQGVLEAAAGFAAERLAPLDAPGDRIGARLADGVVTLPPGYAAAYREWSQAGWNGLALPAAYGGMGLTAMLNTAAMEIWTSGCMALLLGPVVSQGAVEALIAHADPELRDAWLPRLMSGEWTASMALTEAQAGSDLGALTTRAEPGEDGAWRLHGSKVFITYGEHDLSDNIVHLVLGRLPAAPPGSAGISLFLVPKVLMTADGSPGARNAVHCTGLEHKLGLHGSPTCSLAFEGAQAWLVGPPHRGLAAMFTVMNRARLATGMQATAIAEKACQQALAYARERRQGRPAGDGADAAILGHPDVLRMIAVMQAQTAAARAIAYAAAYAIDRADHLHDPLAEARAALLTPIVKAFCSEIGVEVASLNIQVHGGLGYVEQAGAAQLLRDVRVTPIYEGTNGVQAADLVLRKVLKDGGAEVVRLIAELDAIAVAADLPGVAERLAEGLASLKSATAWLLDHAQDTRAVLVSSTPYLRLCGVVIGGALLAKGALASRALAGAEAAGRRIEALAEVYAAHQLPLAGAMERMVISGGAAILGARDALS
jgi:alkylation response protein AidB-like acyl-CoA dehydrogenase